MADDNDTEQNLVQRMVISMSDELEASVADLDLSPSGTTSHLDRVEAAARDTAIAAFRQWAMVRLMRLGTRASVPSSRRR